MLWAYSSMEEQRPSKPKVEGSSPSGPALIFRVFLLSSTFAFIECVSQSFISFSKCLVFVRLLIPPQFVCPKTSNSWESAFCFFRKNVCNVFYNEYFIWFNIKYFFWYNSWIRTRNDHCVWCLFYCMPWVISFLEFFLPFTIASN